MTRYGRTTSGGWGWRHQQLRKRWAPKVATGRVRCARCGEPIAPGHPWDLGHKDDRTGYAGPEHRSCNRGANHDSIRWRTNDGRSDPQPKDPHWQT